MYRELNHPSDICYELVCDDLQEIFSDLIKIFKSCYSPELKNNFIKKEYPVQNPEDMVFDVVNDWIYTISAKKFFPDECKISEKLICKFRKIENLYGTELKALTYHGLQLRHQKGKIVLKVVFDV
ncbi:MULTISPECIES: archease [Pseudothermotoga]|jgi:SHS2 domain-containing protein|uniref:archease n=1 Tax=Pseudothermotoga TaxID=1643951 RepID=UPI00041D6B92|nr:MULTISPECIES: archease [Pseudothermotoga]KUK21797.1 MAG: Uncharacterized protein XD56_0271 [Pseudothermotoga lettingae]MDI3494020.1 protein archease [Pseudothermotoga sp.]MDK2884964.1 protein archease [Pseudothermotoga sp.]HBT25662.1 protein archease [Pseudothermotoga sp.]